MTFQESHSNPITYDTATTGLIEWQESVFSILENGERRVAAFYAVEKGKKGGNAPKKSPFTFFLSFSPDASQPAQDCSGPCHSHQQSL